jgi:hypothetical protein
MNAYEVKRRRGIAHMIDADSHGRKTFCGEQTNRPGWCPDEDATLVEFVEKVRPRCAACRKNCQIVIAMHDLALDLQER